MVDGVTTEVVRAGRDVRLDVLRGLAVVLMVVDHVAGMVLALGGGVGLMWLRVSVTRLSLPLFMLVAGVLWCRRARGLTWRRWFELVAVGAVVSTLLPFAGLPAPDLLLVLALVAPLARFVLRWPVEAAVVGVVQAVNLPVAWEAYQPGYVVLWLALGVLVAERGGVPLWVDRLRPAGLLAGVGRRPLAWYLGHVVVVVLVGQALVDG